jgi:uncharacterized protein
MSVNLRSFRQKVRFNKKTFRSFLTRLEKNPPRQLHQMMEVADKEVWKETDCLTCGNCCKTMTPTYTAQDIKRISNHLGMSVAGFKEKWLVFDKKEGDWQNKNQPCQFLNMKDNKCSIYALRPADCAGFPHLTRKKALDYMHVHKQNVEYCPATFRMVEKMQVMTAKV